MFPLTHSWNTHTHAKGHHSTLTVSMAEIGLTQEMEEATHKAHTLTKWRQLDVNSLIKDLTQDHPNINGTTRAITMEEITHTTQK